MSPIKLPLQSSKNVNIPDHTGTTIEETEAERIPEPPNLIEAILREHVLHCRDSYIGSVRKHEESLWVYSEDSKMEHRSVSYTPGLYKIFDLILVNAADNKRRDRDMDRLEVEINQDNNLISVFHNGYGGIPVEIDKELGVYVPQLIFGHLTRSNNYYDWEKEITKGNNGFGVKLTNIFSKEFVIEIADGKRLLKYKQVFYNMSKKKGPDISTCEASDNWTRVSFYPDLEIFDMSHLDDDIVALMKKRVVDLAGCLSACPGKKVRVLLNKVEIEVNSFHDYAQFYLNSAKKNQDLALPRIVSNSKKDDITPRLQISVSRSEGQFQQVSFVNNINTINGGTLVDYLTTQITEFIINFVERSENVILEPHIVKNHLWIFVNAFIDNPTFDSHQTKGTLITLTDSFRTTHRLSPTFLNEVVDSPGLVESLLLSQEEFTQFFGAKKTRRNFNISKLKDANEAGGSRSHDCTLILTEGDSAEALAIAWLSVVGRDFFGVFPLRGSLLNVREPSSKQITENAEINNIKKILGLKQGEYCYKKSSAKRLRYGHLMIMADKDDDGSHIMRLLIDIIHTLWPSLLRNSSYMLEFDTPRMKAVRGEGKDKEVMSFYSMPEYEEWVKNTGADVNKWTVENKELGTSDSNEGREYFSNLKNNRKVFVWSDDKDGDEIELSFTTPTTLPAQCFNGSRKLRGNGGPDENELAFSKKKIDANKDRLLEEMIKYTYFVDNELKLFSRRDLQITTPSMVDGLTPIQRKVLFCAFKKNLVHAKLEDVTRSIFPKEDDVLLDYLKEDGLQIEPVWYMPIIPMILVNGSKEIGTGWSSFIPNYNPRDIIANIRHLINNESLEPMDPWYKNFNGTIQRAVSSSKESGVTYTVTGTILVVEGDDDDDEDEGPDDETDVKLLITELPIGKWPQDYKQVLETLEMNGFIYSFDYGWTNEAIEISIVLSKENYNYLVATQDGLLKKFKLTTSLTTSNMHLFDKDNKLVKYNSPEQILTEFYHLRLKYYIKRKERYLEIYQAEHKMLDNQVKYITQVFQGIISCNMNKAELVMELRRRDFASFPRVKPVEPVAQGSEELGDSDYDYLFSIAITNEKVNELHAKREKVVNQIEDLKNQSVYSLWLKDLNALEKALEEKDRREAEAAKKYASISNDRTKKPTKESVSAETPARKRQNPITDEMLDASPHKKVRKT